MNFKDFFRDKFYYLLAAAGAMVLIFIFLYVFRVPFYGILYIILLLILVFAFWVIGDYKKRRDYYKELISVFNDLDKKYLISEITEPAAFTDSEIYHDILKQALKAMNDEIAKNNREIEDYKDYVESWVHEIKTPIAAVKLSLDNNPAVFASHVPGDIEKIEQLVTKTLYYARSTATEKDYIIKETTLGDIVKRTLKENSHLLITNRVAVELQNLDIKVFTDAKWIIFILSQIISNAVKYRRDNGARIVFSGGKAQEKAFLKITDNGIGIPAADLPRIFDKSFTGENGRKYPGSTGLGLYLCYKLCVKLGIEITVQCFGSTEFTLIFPITDYYLR